MISRMFAGGALAALLASAASAAAPPPISAFARIPAISDMAISPDGARVAFIRGVKGLPTAMVYELGSNAPPTVVMTSAPKVAKVGWCHFKGPRRLVCGYHGTAFASITRYPVSRLVAADIDGKNMKVLVQNSRLGQSQFQDTVLNWLPPNPARVLIEVNEKDAEFPSVYELDVNDGSLHFRNGPHAPIRNFTTDSSGEVRLGCGFRETSIQCFTRDARNSQWRLLTKFEAFLENAGDAMEPLGFGTDPNILYSLSDVEGRNALWRIDLNDRDSPQLEFMHPLVDIEGTVRARNGRLLAVRYETDRPNQYYLDPDYEAFMRSLAKLLPDRALSVLGRSEDGRRQLIASYSDIDAGTYYLYDRDTGQLRSLGTAYPDLDPAQLGRMQSIEYPARDGTKIPGYLTVPRGFAAKNLPLVVMPHGGPMARDKWAFDFLLQFLVSRGYAVLQMNFRGSSGYGEKWFFAAHQDWGGVTYNDIADGAKWAVASGIADPARMAIVGWSFGGYAALLGAVRDGSSYRCAVSIAGVSDLGELRSEARRFTSAKIVERQIGTDSAKLKADSPVRHAADAATPVLLIHGTDDWQVEVEHSTRMNSALKWAKKPAELLLLDGESHQIDGEEARAKLLDAVEKFLLKNMGPGVSGATAAQPAPTQ